MMKRKQTITRQCQSLAAGLALVLVSCQPSVKLSPDNIDAVLADMTTDEKITLVVGAGNETFTGYGNTKKIVPETDGKN